LTQSKPDGEHSEQRSDVAVSRHFGWQDMFMPLEDDPRSQATTVGERATLTAYLRYYRQTLVMKCAGLDAEAMARRAVPPSDLSLLGLVRHLADVERRWFRQVLAGEDAPYIFRTREDRDAAFRQALPSPSLVSEAWDAWRGEVANGERFVDEAPNLDLTGKLGPAPSDDEISLREVLVHMIEEYARHCGHADLLRERIDGRVGQ
jgi:uncharacterized damage-inducible protein DinB